MAAVPRVIRLRAEGGNAPAGATTKAVVGVLVLGAHLAGVLAWWTMGHNMPLARNAGALAPLTVWLPQLQVPLMEQLKRAVPPESPLSERPRPSGDAASTAVNDVAAQPSAAPSAEGAATETAAASTSPLNLNLPRKALAMPAPPSAAALSAFHGRLPATVEQIIANAAAESGPWTEERLDNDHIRLRRGNTCVLMERPEAAALDPFSDSARRMPWRASVSRC